MFALRFAWIAVLAMLFAHPWIYCPGSAAAETDWPRWRGPHQNGHTSETRLPVTWSAADVVWKADLPGSGQSSPIIWGERIFLTAALGQGRERLVICVDRKTGNIL